MCTHLFIDYIYTILFMELMILGFRNDGCKSTYLAIYNPLYVSRQWILNVLWNVTMQIPNGMLICMYLELMLENEI